MGRYAMMVSMSIVCGFFTSPETCTVHGRVFSVGLAQISVQNLDRMGLSIRDGFDACTNLRAMETILVECHERAHTTGDIQQSLRRALSCYYSGNFATGFRHGYVNRVIRNTLTAACAPP